MKGMMVARSRLDLNVFSYRELEAYPVASNEALILVVDDERWPSEVPSGFMRRLRLKIPHSDLKEGSFTALQARLQHARYAINFVRLHDPSIQRIAVASPDGEIRGPALALGLMVALGFSTQRVEDLARGYPRASRMLRDAVLEAAGKLPPSRLERAAHSPLTKAALLLLARITDGRFNP